MLQHVPDDAEARVMERRQRLSPRLKRAIILFLYPTIAIAGLCSAAGILQGYAAAVLFVAFVLALIGGTVTGRWDRGLALYQRRAIAGESRSASPSYSSVTPALHILRAEDASDAVRSLRRRSSMVWVAYIGFISAIPFATRSTLPKGPLWALLIGLAGFAIYWERRPKAVRRRADARQDIARQRATALNEMATAAPVLYLRSFGDDKHAKRQYGMFTEEEQLAKALAWFGPLIAVGRPGEHLPEAGAQRIYVTDDEWQARVSELMTRARLVVLRTGASQGFMWEVDHAVSRLRPAQLLVVADDQLELHHTLETIARRAGTPLVPLRLRGRPIASVKGLVVFGPQWAPRLLPFKRPRFRVRDPQGPLASRFLVTLGPLLRAHGVSYRLPAISWGKVLVVLILIYYVGENLYQSLPTTP